MNADSTSMYANHIPEEDSKEASVRLPQHNLPVMLQKSRTSSVDTFNLYLRECNKSTSEVDLTKHTARRPSTSFSALKDTTVLPNEGNSQIINEYNQATSRTQPQIYEQALQYA